MKELRSPKTLKLAAAPRSRRVLAVCGDESHGLWMVRNLAQNGLTVLAVCNSAGGLAAYSRYAAGAWAIETPLGSSAFLDEIEELARRLEVGSVMTISEKNHAALIGARERFEPDIHVFSPPAEAFDKATDKDYLHALCLRLGVPVAKGMPLDQFVTTGRGSLRFPLIIRTKRQLDSDAGRLTSWRAAYAEDEAELETLYQSVAAFADNILVHECHPGVLMNVQVLMHRGQPFAIGPYLGEHNYPLAGGSTVQRISFRHEGMMADAVRLLQEIGYEGVAGPEFLFDQKTGKYIFLEMNPRFLGGLPCIVRAGFPAPFLLWQSHFEPEKMQRPNYRVGLRTRIFRADLYWMLGMLGHEPLPPGEQRLGKARTIATFLWNCGPWTKDDTFLLADMLPYFAGWCKLLKSVGGKVWKRFARSKRPDYCTTGRTTP